MHRFRLLLAALVFVALPFAPLADDDHDHRYLSRHGGIVAESGHHHLEVVVRDGVLVVYVAGEDGEPEDVAGARATAVMLSEGKKHDVELKADAAALKGVGSFKAAKGTTIVITLTMPGHEPEQTRITLD